MALKNTIWTAPTFSFDTTDQPTTWRDFYLRATDYLETLYINPEKEDQQKRGWEQITMMFTGENRQILQTLIDNNTITAADQRTTNPSTESHTKQQLKMENIINIIEARIQQQWQPIQQQWQQEAALNAHGENSTNT